MNAPFYHKPGQHWFIRWKLYHIPFWLVYHYLWWATTVGSPVKAAASIFSPPYAIKYLFYVVFQILAVYFNLYYLIPKYLEKSRFTAYIPFLVLTILGAAACIVPGYYLSSILTGKSIKELYGVDSFNLYYLYTGGPLSSTAASMTFAMSIKLAKNWLQTQRRQQQLEKEKLETELNFLKHQFNPHFLFNTINSIFFLIHKNPDMASASLAKFSELLRHQLYECNDRQILLTKEIAYLENSIELEKLRQNDNVEVSLQVDHSYEDLGIAPFILMTFVENAFKHVSREPDTPNWIRIRLHLDGTQLDFSVSNSAAQTATTDVMHYGGIGLKNVRRRLDLIYPGQYHLDIQNTNTRFEIRLRLQLAELMMPMSVTRTA
ncbi:histidine kinase [Flavitalea sp. BT771]|uniref:sensor histidine kinase n=1 Tax=Flavitalea sp. BT771 TaxID=3063329 RepID=UPI0026E4653C|nr:histidine kinase [Flavitalea sp. BT771]MDO6429113.1 histidine kinase [Flavitalea sp. BT771]MDV6218759.1 histidine kinase [Flavitalea sp. BT771]